MGDIRLEQILRTDPTTSLSLNRPKPTASAGASSHVLVPHLLHPFGRFHRRRRRRTNDYPYGHCRQSQEGKEFSHWKSSGQDPACTR